MVEEHVRVFDHVAQGKSFRLQDSSNQLHS
jgi:hypothetical protein